MAQKKIEIIIDIDNKDIQFATDKTLSLTQQIKLLKVELQKTKEGTKEFEILRNKLNETQDQFARVNAKSRELFGTLSLIPGPIGEIAGKVNGAISLLKTFSGFSFKELKSQFGGLVDDIKNIFTAIGGFGAATEKAADTTKSFGDDLTTFAQKTSEYGTSLTNTSKAETDAYTEQIQTLAKVAEAQTQTIEKTQDQIAANLEGINSIEQVNQLSNEQINTTIDLIDAQEAQVEALGNTIGQIETLQAAQAAETSATNQNTVAQGENAVAQEAAAAGAATNTQATNVLTAAQLRSAAAARILRGVLLSLGIGALIALIGGIISKLVEFVEAKNEAKDSVEKFNTALENEKRLLGDVQGGITQQILLDVERAKQAGKTEAEIFKIKKEGLEKQLEEQRKSSNRIALILNAASRGEGEFAEKSQKAKNEIIEKYAKQREDSFNKEQEIQRQIELEGEREKTRIIEDGRKKREKSAKDEGRTRLEILKADLDAQIELEIQKENTNEAKLKELLDRRYNIEVDNTDKTENEKALIRAQYSEKLVQAITEDTEKIKEKNLARLDAEIELEKNKGEKGIETSKEVLQRLYNERLAIELQNTKLSEQEKEALRQKYARELQDEIKSDLKTISEIKEQNLITELDKNRGNFEEQIRLYKEFQQSVIGSENYTGVEKVRILDETNKKILELQAQRFQQEKNNLDIQLSDGKITQEQYFNELLALYEKEKQDYKNLHEQKKITDAEYSDFLKKNAEDRIAVEEKQANARIQLAQAVGSSLNALAGLVGQQTKAGKAFAVAATLINTYAAIAAQLRAAAASPGAVIPGYAIAQAIATGLVGFKAVADILKTPVPNAEGEKGGGPQFNTGTIQVQGRARGGMIYGPGTATSDSIPAMLSNGEYVVNARSTRMFQPLLQKINSFGNDIPKFQMGGMVMGAAPAVGQSNNMSLSEVIGETLRREPIRTYVTSTEMSNQQQFDRVIKSRSLI